MRKHSLAESGSSTKPLPVITSQLDFSKLKQRPKTILSQEVTCIQQCEFSLGHTNKRKISSCELRSESPNPGATQSEGDNEKPPKVEKPTGESGRPGRGGYNLQKELQWSASQFKTIKEYVKELCKDHLDLSKSYKYQDNTLLKVVRNKALDKFPLLDNYVRAWPVDDLIRAHLKYSSSSGRRQQEKKAAGLNLGPRS